MANGEAIPQYILDAMTDDSVMKIAHKTRLVLYAVRLNANASALTCSFHLQNQDAYNKRYDEYAQKSDEIKRAIAALQAKIARHISRKELLDGMMRELDTANLSIAQFDEKLWRIMVEHVTAGINGELLFRFRNGMEVTVK